MILFHNFGFFVLPFRDTSEFMLRMDLHKCLSVTCTERAVRGTDGGFVLQRAAARPVDC